MRAASIITLSVLLSACTGTGIGMGDLVETASAGGTCRNDALAAYIGQKVTAELGAEMLAKSGARTLRWGAPGTAMTMDYRQDRLTVSYDDAMMITSARCG